MNLIIDHSLYGHCFKVVYPGFYSTASIVTSLIPFMPIVNLRLQHSSAMCSTVWMWSPQSHFGQSFNFHSWNKYPHLHCPVLTRFRVVHSYLSSSNPLTLCVGSIIDSLSPMLRTTLSSILSYCRTLSVLDYLLGSKVTSLTSVLMFPVHCLVDGRAMHFCVPQSL